jgi:hypothetical protein
MDAASHLA